MGSLSIKTGFDFLEKTDCQVLAKSFERFTINLTTSSIDVLKSTISPIDSIPRRIMNVPKGEISIEKLFQI